MALRDQPYLPLYIQDYLTDEALNECSSSTQGIYIKIMCVLHKTEEYGKILLKQNDKHGLSKENDFALKLKKQLTFSVEEIQKALRELVDNKVMVIDGDYLFQKRMVRDNEISIKRSESGKKGGEKTQFASKFAKAKVKAKRQANSENENENINNKVPSIEEISQYCSQRKNKIDPQYFLDYQTARDWKLKGGQKIKDWKAVIRTWEQNNFNTTQQPTKTEIKDPFGHCVKCGTRRLKSDLENGICAGRCEK